MTVLPSTSSLSPHPLSPHHEGTSVSPVLPLSDYSDDLDCSPSPGFRPPNFSLSPEDVNLIILTDCADGARLSPAKLAEGLAPGGVFPCSPTGGHFRIFRVRGVICFSTINDAADRPGPGFQSLTSAPQFQWPQNRSELILWQSEHADILSRDLSSHLAASPLQVPTLRCLLPLLLLTYTRLVLSINFISELWS